MAAAITEDDRDTFTSRCCGALAVELRKRTGWPIVLVADGPNGCVGWVHAGVRKPDGRIIDVEGEHDERDWLDRWAEYVDCYGVDHEDYDSEDVCVVNAADMPGGGYMDDCVPSDIQERITAVADALTAA